VEQSQDMAVTGHKVTDYTTYKVLIHQLQTGYTLTTRQHARTQKTSVYIDDTIACKHTRVYTSTSQRLVYCEWTGVYTNYRRVL